jgi:hypothetical protein
MKAFMTIAALSLLVAACGKPTPWWVKMCDHENAYGQDSRMQVSLSKCYRLGEAADDNMNQQTRDRMIEMTKYF